jgi:WD40 repeat protein
MQTRDPGRWHNRRSALIAPIQVVLASVSLILLALVQNTLVRGNPVLQNWRIDQSVTTINFSPDGKLLALGTENGAVQVRQVSSGTLLNTLSGLGPLTFSPDGKILASGGDGGSVHLWEVPAGMLLHTLAGHKYMLRALSFSPNGKSLASVDEDGSVRLWRTSDWQLTKTLSSDSDQSAGNIVPLGLGFSNNGQTVLVGGASYRVYGWQLPGGNPIQPIAIEPANRMSTNLRLAEFSPNGERIGIAPLGSAMYIYTISDGQLLHQLGGRGGIGGSGHQADVWSIAFSPSGTLLASGGGSCAPACSEDVQDNSVRIWRMSDGSEQAKFEGHTKNVRSLAWSPDEKILASGSDDGTLRLWKVK